MDDYTPTERPVSPPRVFAAWNGPASRRPAQAGGLRGSSPPRSPRGPDTTHPQQSANSGQQRPRNAGGGGKANWRPTAKLPASAKEQEAAEQLRVRRQAALASEPLDYEVSRVTSTFYPSGRAGGGSGNGGGGRYGGVTQIPAPGGAVAERNSGRAGPPSPLDDLLSHVNHLLADFDSKFG